LYRNAADDYSGKETTLIVLTSAICKIPQLEELAKESLMRVVDAVEEHKESWDRTYF
jgi:hypothetical protein